MDSSQYTEVAMAGVIHRVERIPFVFEVGVEIRNDLNSLKREGWKLTKGSHFRTRGPDGGVTVTLILHRFTRRGTK